MIARRQSNYEEQSPLRLGCSGNRSISTTATNCSN